MLIHVKFTMMLIGAKRMKQRKKEHDSVEVTVSDVIGNLILSSQGVSH